MKWETLESVQEGETLSLKGFLFQSADGKWILSNEPDLKSCCVGSPHKQKSQVILAGDFSSYSKSKPLEVKGVMHVNANGFYTLSEAEGAQKGVFPFWTFAIVLVVAAGFRLKRLLLP